MNSCETNRVLKIEDNPKVENCRSESKVVEPVFTPAFDVFEDDEALLLFGDLPGVQSEDLSVEFEGEQLVVSGRHSCVDHKTTYLYRSIQRGKFRRAFAVSLSIDTEHVSAEFKHGLLTIKLPKRSPRQPKRISVVTE